MAQKAVEAKQPWSQGVVRAVVWPVQQGGKHPELDGFGDMTVSTGTAVIRMFMTPEQMRELAAALVAQSWEVEA